MLMATLPAPVAVTVPLLTMSSPWMPCSAAVPAVRGRQRAVVGDRIVDAGHGGDEGAGDAVLDVDADRGAAVDRIGRGHAGARHGERDPGLRPVLVDMEDPGTDGAVAVDRIGHQVVGVGAAAAGDALEMRDHGAGAGRVVVGVDAGVLVEDVGPRQAGPEARAAGDAVAVDAVGGGAGEGARAVDGRHRAGRRCCRGRRCRRRRCRCPSCRRAGCRRSSGRSC